MVGFESCRRLQQLMMAALAILQMLSFFWCSTVAFNVDVSDPYVYYAGKNGYFFGFALALHRNEKRGEKWLLAGAPLGNDTALGVKQRWGALYKCDVSSAAGQCTVMKEFDKSEPGMQSLSDTKYNRDEKNDQWYGATVHAHADHVMVCAPRFVLLGRFGRDYFTAGRCELYNLETNSHFYWEPCNGSAGMLKYDFCEVGLAAAMSNDGKTFMASAVGENSFAGSLMTTSFGSNKTHFSHPTNPKKNDYLGYAVALGPMSSEKKRVYAGGAPRKDKERGQVLLFKALTPDLHAHTILSSPIPQVGAYFGAALLALDHNGDGYADLVVGAPYHSWKYDEGAAFVFTNNQQNGMLPLNTPLVGDKSIGAQFGKTMAKSDLNRDGYEDAIIGAPFENDGKGAVYLYYGSAKGLYTKYSQKISPSGLRSGLTLRTFGYGVSDGVDIDDNRYPDIAIGSFMSDKATVLRSRPVITITSIIDVNVKTISLTSKKSLCLGKDGISHACIKIKLSFKFTEDTLQIATIIYTLDIDSSRIKTTKRGFTYDNGKNVTKVTKQIDIPVNGIGSAEYSVFLVNNTRDIFDPLILSLSFSYKEPVPCKLCPIQNPFAPRLVEAKLPYVKDCGNDNVCESDLVVSAKTEIPNDDKVVRVGVEDTFKLLVTVENKKENAFNTRMTVNITSALYITNVQAKEGLNPLWEVKSLASNLKQLEFQVANPLSTNQKVEFEIKVSVNPLKTTTEDLPFALAVTTQSNEVNPADNMISLKVPLLVEADMALSGLVVPVTAIYSDTVLDEKIVGPRVTHTFLVQNKGPSTALQSKVNIEFPDRVGKTYFLNLYKMTIEGPGSCDLDTTKLNPLKLNLNSANTSVTRKRRAVDQIVCDGSAFSCQKIQCNLGQLTRGQRVVIKFQSTLVQSTFNQVFKGSREIHTRATVKPTKIKQPEKHSPDTVDLVFTAMAPPSITSKGTASVAWWVILLSVLAGVILIAGVVFVLYRKGFFSRKKHLQVPSNEEDDL